MNCWGRRRDEWGHERHKCAQAYKLSTHADDLCPCAIVISDRHLSWCWVKSSPPGREAVCTAASTRKHTHPNQHVHTSCSDSYGSFFFHKPAHSDTLSSHLSLPLSICLCYGLYSFGLCQPGILSLCPSLFLNVFHPLSLFSLVSVPIFSCLVVFSFSIVVSYVLSVIIKVNFHSKVKKTHFFPNVHTVYVQYNYVDDACFTIIHINPINLTFIPVFLFHLPQVTGQPGVHWTGQQHPKAWSKRRGQQSPREHR